MKVLLALLPLALSCVGGLRPALRADAGALAAPDSSARAERPQALTGGGETQLETVDPRDLPLKRLVLDADWRRLARPAAAPRTAPTAPQEAQLASKEPVRSTDGGPPRTPANVQTEKPAERKAFLRPAIEETNEKTKPPSHAAIPAAPILSKPTPAVATPEPPPEAALPKDPPAEPLKSRAPAASVAREVAPRAEDVERMEAVAQSRPATTLPEGGPSRGAAQKAAAELDHHPQASPVATPPVVVTPTLPPPLPLDSEEDDPATAREEEAREDTSAQAPLGPEARYQVQIMSASDPENAEDMRMQALLVFPGEHVEVVWDPPNYKVRVGGAANIEAANELKRKALRLGFQNAWVVPRRTP